MCSEFHFHIYPRWNQDTPKVIKLQENFVFPHEQLLTFEQEDFILGRRNLISRVHHDCQVYVIICSVAELNSYGLIQVNTRQDSQSFISNSLFGRRPDIACVNSLIYCY